MVFTRIELDESESFNYCLKLDSPLISSLIDSPHRRLSSQDPDSPKFDREVNFYLASQGQQTNKKNYEKRLAKLIKKYRVTSSSLNLKVKLNPKRISKLGFDKCQY